ncbi:hypothetical protein EV368DRAFT_66113 [Lentinula lateritia]|nr:hypothetical protein EV368DRAFT_66113 [Lentinula lateritia]
MPVISLYPGYLSSILHALSHLTVTFSSSDFTDIQNLMFLIALMDQYSGHSIMNKYMVTEESQKRRILIGNSVIHNLEGLAETRLRHLKFCQEYRGRSRGITRFYRWHIDAALYDLSPPRVTTLYAVRVPEGPNQICRYDDGTGDELEVPLATTAFVSGQTMFQLLPSELKKSVAVWTNVKYAPHPYVWMAPAHAKSTGLGIESEGLETPLEQLRRG